MRPDPHGSAVPPPPPVAAPMVSEFGSDPRVRLVTPNLGLIEKAIATERSNGAENFVAPLPDDEEWWQS